MRLYFSLNTAFHLLCLYLGLKIQKLNIAHATNLVLLNQIFCFIPKNLCLWKTFLILLKKNLQIPIYLK